MIPALWTNLEKIPKLEGNSENIFGLKEIAEKNPVPIPKHLNSVPYPPLS